MRRSWIAFVRGGDPSHEMLPAWPRYDNERRWTMRLGARNISVGDPAGLAVRNNR
jgi:para-nitrobenzyl esterase